MKIYDFTRPELEHLENQCNFTKEEGELFLLRSRGISLEMCAEHLNMSTSTVKRLSKRVNSKIQRILG